MKEGHYDVIVYLVEHGANIHSRLEEALTYEAMDGYYDIIDYLVGHGANIHVLSEFPPEHAAENGHNDVVTYLFQHGADISDCYGIFGFNWRSQCGYTSETN